ncbi:hypothetical protein D3C75_722240 [compost metagenome]
MYNLQDFHPFSVVWACMVIVWIVPGSSADITRALPDLSMSDSDRKSVIWADQAILRGKRTENPLFARSPLILGSNDGYNGS